MKTLTLLRHAKSGWDDGVARDFDRPLNAKGKRAGVEMGRHLRAEARAFDHVVASPALRVVETLAAVEQGYGAALTPTWDRTIYLASAATLLDLIRDLPAEAGRVLMVGHNPGIEELVLLLVADDGAALRDRVEAKYPTGAVAELELTDGWSGAGRGTARLTRFVRPRDLDATLGPDAD
ncbi:histidine phosphatase family protein [Sphingomonas sp. KR1UV-12]|uniref:Histidine phosphatase family protein n=1 Tax=Sphingomonas aurea TaxID=3063994 RepID=A0ABT9EM55_9SPHN|nr:histidine phosphatase family protein [Sphingomonas sp. KR1UV-12]MDP1028037.1 histidine phosphatase family protein [Sphingomonas sp. KR1UV-12]